MNIFFRELKANLKSLLTWSGFLLLFVFLCTAKFSAFYNDPSMLKMVMTLGSSCSLATVASSTSVPLVTR